MYITSYIQLKLDVYTCQSEIYFNPVFHNTSIYRERLVITQSLDICDHPVTEYNETCNQSISHEYHEASGINMLCMKYE